MRIAVGSKFGGKRLSGASSPNGSKHPLFTVVTAVFNSAEPLESTILSVLNQELSDDVEHIIIDGGSTDATLDVLCKYDNSVDCWTSEPDKGVYDAFNKGCRLATGEWTIFLGAGDLFYDGNVLTSISDAMRNISSETEIIYGKVCLTNEVNTPVDTFNAPWDQIYGKWNSGRPMLPHHQGIFHRRCLISAKSPFDTSYKIAADSKLLYESIRRARPVFCDILVTSASIGGVSTDVKHSMAAAKEVLRINREFGFTNYPHQLWFYFKAVVKKTISALGGEAFSRRCVDEYRRITGRPRLQTR